MGVFKKWIVKNILKVPYCETVDFTAHFIYDGQPVRYSNASGFFMFGNHVFFKTDKESVGKSLEDIDMTFSEMIAKINPKIYKNLSLKDIGNLSVHPLHVHVHEKN